MINPQHILTGSSFQIQHERTLDTLHVSCHARARLRSLWSERASGARRQLPPWTRPSRRQAVARPRAEARTAPRTADARPEVTSVLPDVRARPLRVARYLVQKKTFLGRVCCLSRTSEREQRARLSVATARQSVFGRAATRLAVARAASSLRSGREAR